VVHLPVMSSNPPFFIIYPACVAIFNLKGEFDGRADSVGSQVVQTRSRGSWIPSPGRAEQGVLAKPPSHPSQTAAHTSSPEGKHGPCSLKG
jgi:hypothetical protein